MGAASTFLFTVNTGLGGPPCPGEGDDQGRRPGVIACFGVTFSSAEEKSFYNPLFLPRPDRL
jgi:hypothetical protein